MLADVECGYLTAVLRAKGGNRTRAAAALGIGPATLYRKLKEYDRAAATRPSCPGARSHWPHPAYSDARRCAVLTHRTHRLTQ
jgi:hypothetical protein